MTKSICRLLVFALSVVPAAAFADPTDNTLFMRTVSLPNSWAEGIVEGSAFVSVNGLPIPFFTRPGTAQRLPCEPDYFIDASGYVRCNANPGTETFARQRIAAGQFSNALLRAGPNLFSFGITTLDDQDHCTDNLHEVTLLPRGGRLSTLFLVRRTGRAYNGTAIKNLSLAEIAPELARDIELLYAQLDQYLAKLEALEGHSARVQRAAELKTELDRLLEKGFGNITDGDLDVLFESFRDVLSSELQARLRGFLSDLRAELETLRSDLRSLLEGSRDQLAQLGQVLSQIDAPVDRAAFADNLANEPAPQVDQPHTERAPEDTRPDPFAAQADSTTAELVSTISEGRVARRLEFIQILRAWLDYAVATADALAASGGALADDVAAFEAAKARVQSFVQQYMDEDLYFRDLNIPAHIKVGVRDRIAAVDPQRAEQIRVALNTWPGGLFTPEEQMVLDMLDGVAAGFGSVLAGASEAQGVLTPLLDQLTVVASTVTEVGLSLAPGAGDFQDYCEAVTGRRLCLPQGEQLTTWDRSAAAVGLFLGSRLFWRTVGGYASGTFRAVASEATLLADWLRASLPDLPSAKSILNVISSRALFRQLSDISAAELKALLDIHGKDLLVRLAGDLTGTEIKRILTRIPSDVLPKVVEFEASLLKKLADGVRESAAIREVVTKFDGPRLEATLRALSEADLGVLGEFFTQFPRWRPPAAQALARLVGDRGLHAVYDRVATKVLANGGIEGMEEWTILASRQMNPSSLDPILNLEQSLDDAIAMGRVDLSTAMEVNYVGGNRVTYAEVQEIRATGRPADHVSIDVETASQRREWKRISAPVTHARQLNQPLNEALRQFEKRRIQSLRSGGLKANIAFIECSIQPTNSLESEIRSRMNAFLEEEPVRIYLDRIVIRYADLQGIHILGLSAP